jgi:glycosyltransferase involved in cell wall biosynthesis
MPLLSNDPRVTELSVFIPAGHNDLLLESGVTVYSIPSSNMLRTVSWLKKEIVAWKPDVVFVPTARGVACGDKPVVTMVRNMEPLVMPFSGNPVSERFKNIGRLLAARRACRRANRVIAVSNYVKNWLVRKWNIKEQEIGVVYHGVDPKSYIGGSSESIVVSMESSPFLFTAGSIRPGRGLEDIIMALAILDTGKPVHLGIGGDVDRRMEAHCIRLKKMAVHLGIAERIHWLGKLNNAQMAWCYSHCEAFVMTSRVEACPNIALEAMSNGCITVASQNPPLPEFFAESAFYYPPKDAIGLAQAIGEALSLNDHEREAKSSTAKRIASGFSWKNCAVETVTELQKAIDASRR